QNSPYPPTDRRLFVGTRKKRDEIGPDRARSRRLARKRRCLGYLGSVPVQLRHISSHGSRILLHQSERAAKKGERLRVFSLLHHGGRHGLVTGYSFGNHGSRASLGEGFFIDSDCSCQVTYMSQRRSLDVR